MMKKSASDVSSRTSSSTTSDAFLSSAACAALIARSRMGLAPPSSVGRLTTPRVLRHPVQAARGDVCRDFGGGEKADRTALSRELAKLRRRYVESGHAYQLEATPTSMPEPPSRFVVPEGVAHGNR